MINHANVSGLYKGLDCQGSQPVKVTPIINGEAEVNYQNLNEYIIKTKCIKCHQGPQAEPENDPVDLSSYELIMEDRFIPVLIKGSPQRSRLFLTVESFEMPPKVPLEPEEIEFIRKWIENCAPKDSKVGNCNGSGSGDDGPGDDEPGDDEPSDD